MVEDLVKLMVEQWSLPEHQVRNFLTKSLHLNADANSDEGLEALREAVAGLLQDHILSENEQ